MLICFIFAEDLSTNLKVLQVLLIMILWYVLKILFSKKCGPFFVFNLILISFIEPILTDFKSLKRYYRGFLYRFRFRFSKNTGRKLKMKKKLFIESVFNLNFNIRKLNTCSKIVNRKIISMFCVIIPNLSK